MTVATAQTRGTRGSKAGKDHAARGARFLAFILEQHPFSLPAAEVAWARAAAEPELSRAHALVRAAYVEELARLTPVVAALPEPQPFVSAHARLDQEVTRAVDALDGFFAREAVLATLSADDKRWMLEGIVLTRAVDNAMKQLFLSSEFKYGELGFQGKGFRSLGQEAIYGAALRLKRGDVFSRGGAWQGDVVGPLIRDLGVSLAFTDDVTMCLNAQVGKDGPPSSGRDLHLGKPERGVLMVAAPLTVATCTVVGEALAFKRKGEARVAFSFIGEGGSSLGEWHEAINMAAAMKLPAVFCLENNQTALSVPVREQSRVRTFADKAVGYGIPHVTVDGTDPEALAAAFAWAADRARAGHGPALIEPVAMRMAGHAHHDDMLYLGADPPLGFDVPETPHKGYVDKAKYAAWRARDPLARYSNQLIDQGVVTARDVEAMKARALARVAASIEELKGRPWPDAGPAGARIVEGVWATPITQGPGADAVEDAPPFDPKGATYLDAVARGVEDVLVRVPEAFVLGEDVGPPYGNAFLLLKPLVERFPDRLLNTPIAEGAIIGACVGAALEGLRPIGEMQFNDFVASGFNQLVNNAAKLHARAGTRVPMTLRMPWGGLRRAGPYHSQDTAPWFFRTPGLKIVAPSTPHDARALLMSAVLDDDPVLFYEHIALYRDPRVKQLLSDAAPTPLPLGRAALRRTGSDLSIIAYGAYVHRALRAAAVLEREDGASCDILDLRSLMPIDWASVFASVRRTGKVLLVGEDSRTGSILESVASRIAEECFMDLDGPVRVRGALDAPVPYAPSLEDAFLLSEADVLAEARALLAF